MPIDEYTLNEILSNDKVCLVKAEKSYGDSWKKRGGVDSFMMLARKWDRIEYQVQKEGYNILELCMKDRRPEGIMDDVRDLRRYLLLVEHEVTRRLLEEKEEGAGAGYVDQDTSDHRPG